MKVAVVSKHFPNSREPWRGHSAYQTLRVLAKMCDLHVFYPVGICPPLLERRKTPRNPLDDEWHPDEVAATYIPFPVFPGLSRPFNGALISRHLFSHVRRFHPDILLNYILYPDGYAALRIARRLAVPVVVTAVGSDINRISDRLVRGLTKYTLRHADFVSTVSQDLCDKARLLGADPARSRAKLNGCDTSIFQPRDRRQSRISLGIDVDAKVIVYVGRIDVRKGLIELADAIAELAPHTPGLRCYIVGDGPDDAKLREAIARHGIAENVLIVPACSTGQVAVWMSVADLITLPSYAEGCPNVVIEALSAGRPVVACAVGGIPELVDDTCGRLVPPRDAPALAKALQDVLHHPWDAAEMSRRHGRSWKDVAGELYEVLTETIAASPRGHRLTQG